MPRIHILAFIAVMITLGTAGAPGAAQEAVPSGSYRQTCSDISVKKDSLYARCQDAQGKTHSAKLAHYEKCSDIVNKKGSLECVRQGHGGAPSAQPRGSYTESCHDITMKGSTLHAICRSADGREAPTTLRDANHCAQGVVNVNGVLNCEVSEVLPPGSYLTSCKDVRMQGTTLMATCTNNKDRSVSAELRDAHKCSGDITNHDGKLQCVPITKMEKR
jgi:CVNH domain